MELSPPRTDASPDLMVESPEARPTRFVHATGSKPLDGYTIKRGVGRGGFGEVYFATSDAGKEVALKLIRRNLDVELRGVTHCLNFKHPNLIALYDIRTDSMGDQWVVMEYVAGESLEAAIERHPNGMPVEEALRWIRGIGAGVAYLHDHGIVHRDLKPGNVFLDTDTSDGGTVKIGDYGLSKFISCSRRSGQTESVGTVHYMAPEIANGRYGREIDTYALGIMLYEMLTGHVPFEGESVGEVLMKHLTAEPNLDKLDEPFREIVKRTLAKDPEVRIATVGELLSLLPGASGQPPVYLPPKVNAPRTAGGPHPPIYSERVVPPVLPVSTRLGEVREPLYEAVSSLAVRWHEWEVNRGVKGLLLFLAVATGVVAVISTAVFPAAMLLLGLIYLVYYFCWATFIKPIEQRRLPRVEGGSPESARVATDQQAEGIPLRRVEAASAAVATTPPLARNPVARRRLRANWQQQVNEQLAAKPTRQLIGELLKSMVLSGILCAFLSLLVVMVIGSSASIERVPLHGWLWTVSTVGSWAVLAIAKLAEGRCEDQIPMRLGMLVCGAALGWFAWGVANALMIGVPVSTDAGIRFQDSLNAGIFERGMVSQDVMNALGHPTVAPDLVLSVLYFAMLFLVLRWWRLAEYTRRVRMSVMATLGVVIAAWLMHWVAWYPQPTGVTVAALIAVSTQLVSPWLPPSGRKTLADQAVAGQGGYN